MIKEKVSLDGCSVHFGYEYKGNGLFWDNDFKSWHLAGWISLKKAAELCNIPHEEVLLLTIKYGH